MLPRVLPSLLGVAVITLVACQGPDAKASISSPDNLAHYVAGDSIWFQGEVGSNHPVDIAVQGDWVWTSDLDGELGDRALFRRNDLSLGEHLITLRVRNDAGLVLRDQVRIFIDPPR
jgi:hypothetical protein